LADDAHSGATTVSAGTLLVGSLPSVFAGALQSGVTFNSALSSAAALGDPGDSGGTFTLNAPDITGGTASIGSDGILTWTPGAGCQAAAYPVTVTYAYSGGHQVRAFTLNTEATTMPPVFDLMTYASDPISTSRVLWHFQTTSDGDAYLMPDFIHLLLLGPDTYYFSYPFPARGGQGTLVYSLSGNPPSGATIDADGNFSCILTTADYVSDGPCSGSPRRNTPEQTCAE
jgi:hypothetical protein